LESLKIGISMKKLVFTLLFSFLLVLTSACNDMKKIEPEKHFTGPQLALAKAIEAADRDAVGSLSKETDLNTPGKEQLTLLFFALNEAMYNDNPPRDFVEFPSQINEHWASQPQVFAHYARHYQSGEPMPDALRDKMLRATQFNKGYDMTELLSAALLDMNWHGLAANAEVNDVASFEAQAIAKEKLDLAAVPPRYRSSYFSHIFGGGYAAGYYAYLWTQMLADDGYQWFVEQGGLNRENGQKFRDAILSRGNSTDLAELYRQWRGNNGTVEKYGAQRMAKLVD